MVKINNELAGKFHVSTEVKQGDPLSATLFSIAMEIRIERKHLHQTEAMHCLCR